MSNAAASAEPAVALPPLRLSQNATAYFAGNFVHALSQVALLIALTRLGEPTLVGQYALGLAVTGPIMLVANLQLRSVQVTDAAGLNTLGEYVALRLVTVAAAMAAIVIAALLIGRSAAAFAVIVLVGACKNIDSISDVYRGYMQRCERMERVAISMMLRAVVAVPSFLLCLWLGAGLTAAVAAMAAASLLTWWYWDVRNARQLMRGSAAARHPILGVDPRFHMKTLRDLARTALPLGLVAMLLSFNSFVPQLAVKQFQGEAQLGIFAALLWAALAVRLLIGAAGQSASPRLARYYQTGNRSAFLKLHRQLLAFGVIVGLTAVAGAALVGRQLLALVYGATYAAHAQLFVLLCLVSAVVHLVSLQGYTVTATREFRAQFPAAIAVASMATCAAWLLVPRYGLSGAAAAVLLGALVQGTAYSVLLQRALRRMPSRVMERAHAGF